MWKAVGHGLVDPKKQGCSAHAGFVDNVRQRKNFHNACRGFGERCLFFSTTFFNEIKLPGDRVNNRLVKHLVIRGVQCASNCP